MKLVAELLPQALLLEPVRFVDERGSFVKTFNTDIWAQFGAHFDMREEFYSSSHKGVIRGMHFQSPPHAHDKVVFCLNGSVQDVLLDLRPGQNFGTSAATILSAANRRVLFIPAGIAHGFKALENDSLLVYKTSTVHSPESDCGIRWDSFGFDWGTDDYIVSTRDKSHQALSDCNPNMFASL